MIEQTIPLSAGTDPREWKQLLLAAAARGPTAIEATTGMIYVLRQREIERLLHEPRLRGVGLSLFDRMDTADGPLRDWYGALMFTSDGAAQDRLRRLVSKAFTPRAVVMCSFLAANRDPDVWQDADSFVPQRFANPSAPRLLSFGGGPQYCLGAALARMTVEEAVRGVTELAPTLSADPDDIEWVQSLGRSPSPIPVAV